MLITKTHNKGNWKQIKCACQTITQFEEVAKGDVFVCGRCRNYIGIMEVDYSGEKVLWEMISPAMISKSYALQVLNKNDLVKREKSKFDPATLNLKQLETAKRALPVNMQATQQFIEASSQNFNLKNFVVAIGSSDDYINVMQWQIAEAWFSGTDKVVFYVNSESQISASRVAIESDEKEEKD